MSHSLVVGLTTKSYSDWPPAVNKLFVQPKRSYPWLHGTVTFSGTVKFGPSQTPVERIVFLSLKKSGQILESVLSDPITGAFSFPGTWSSSQEFVVTSYDHSNTYNSIIKDRFS